jgi:hypothetical protein
MQTIGSSVGKFDAWDQVKDVRSAGNIEREGAVTAVPPRKRVAPSRFLAARRTYMRCYRLCQPHRCAFATEPDC